MSRRGGSFASGLVVAIIILLPIAAYGAYSVFGSSSGGASAANLPAPGKPVIVASNSGLTISWAPTTLSTGRAVDSYQLKRTVATTTTPVCTTAALGCTDSQPTQTVSYVVTARLASWTSTSASTQFVPDTTPPTITNLALSADTGSSSTDFVTDVVAQTLSGKTEAGATVTVLYNAISTTHTADASGNFAADLTLVLGARDAKITAVDAAGNAASVTRSITLTAAATPASNVVVTGNSDTAMLDIDWQIPNNPTGQFCATTTLTGTSLTPKAWQLLIHLDQPPFYGATANEIFYRGNSQVNVAAVPGDPALARVTGTSSPGNPWNDAWNNALLDTSRTLTITLCDSNPRLPTAGDSSWYAANQVQATRSANKACVELTVSATTAAAQNPFYFGWQATIDLTAAKQYLIANGKTINFVGWSPDPSNGYQFMTAPTVMNPVSNIYALTSGRMTPIKAGSSTTITACVNAF